MIMKRKGFDAAQNSQMDLRINRLKKKKKKSVRINVVLHAISPSRNVKKLGPIGCGSPSYSTVNAWAACINIHKQA